MARSIFAVILLLAAFVQASFLPALFPFGVLPNLVLVLLLVWVALRGVTEGLVWVLGAGILLDALAMDPLGTNGLALLPVIAAGLARRRFFHSSMIVPLILAVVATIFHGLILMFLRSFEAGGGLPPVMAVVRLTFLQSMLNAVLVPPFYAVASRVNRWEPERA